MYCFILDVYLQCTHSGWFFRGFAICFYFYHEEFIMSVGDKSIDKKTLRWYGRWWDGNTKHSHLFIDTWYMTANVVEWGCCQCNDVIGCGRGRRVQWEVSWSSFLWTSDSRHREYRDWRASSRGTRNPENTHTETHIAAVLVAKQYLVLPFKTHRYIYWSPLWCRSGDARILSSPS